MPRSTRGPRPSSSPVEDRKAIEQRARDAAAPLLPAKKGQWPFAPEDASDGNHHSSDGPSGNRKDPGQFTFQ